MRLDTKKKAHALKIIVKSISLLMGIFGLVMMLFMGWLFVPSITNGEFAESLLLLPFVAAQAILVLNAVCVFKYWSKRSIGLFSAIIALICSSIVANYVSETVGSAAANDEQPMYFALSFSSIAALIIVFVCLKGYLVKHTLSEGLCN